MLGTTFQSLSFELVESCLSKLTPHDLASVSLASRTMQALTFPSLYQTVYLCLGSHIECISARLSAEKETTRLRIGTHLRHLIFDDRYGCEGDADRSEAMARFQEVISKLEHLRHLQWKSSWLPEDSYIFEAFQQSCPALCSVSLYIAPEWFDFEDENYLNALFSFRDKTNITLRSERLDIYIDDYFELPQALTDMVRGSPNLQSLELDLEDISMSRLKWSPDQVCSGLSDTTFPDLRVFRTLGKAEPDWQAFFEGPIESPYHSFFRRHPSLHTISIGWVHEHFWSIDEPEQLAELFPALRYFEGPAFICQALACSSLATQLKSLSLLDQVLAGDEIVEFADHAVKMPQLQSLAFALEAEQLDNKALSKVLSLSPALKELAVQLVTSNLDELVGILKHAPDLEELKMEINMMLDIVKGMGKTSASDLVRELARRLPKLRTVHDLSQPELQRRWEIRRVNEQDVHVAHVQLVREGPLGRPFSMLLETLYE